MSSQDVRTGSVVTESFAENQPLGDGSDAPPDPTETPSTPVAASGAGTDGNAGNGEPHAADNAPSAEPEAPPRRLRLNPTVDPSQVRAVPSISTPTAAPATSAPESSADTTQSDTSAADQAAEPAPADTPTPTAVESADLPAAADPSPVETVEAKPQAVAETDVAPPAVERPVSSEPVEIPTDDDLDADLEAEIAAAMSADEQSAAAVAVPSEAVEAASTEVPGDEAPEAGAKIKGVVQSLHAENVFFDLGFRAPGLAQLRQFGGKQPAVGDEVEVVVDRFDEEEGLVYVNLPRSARRVGGDWSALTVGQTVECTVSKTNKGGLEVEVGTLRGFMPAGQVDLGFVSDLEPFVGQKMQAQVVEVNPRRRNLVLSRRALLEAERKDAEVFLWAKLEVGQTYDGTVKTVKDYGAFVDIGGVDGFLHIGEISWTRIKHPSEVLQPGQDVRVKVISLDPEKKRIGLGMRQLTNNPWLDAAEKYAKGTTVRGKVTRTSNFGAFVQLEPGVEGLVHISELDHRRVKSVTEVLNVDQEAEFQVLEVDPNRKRVSLSMKALVEKPEPEPGGSKGSGPSAEPSPQRKPRSDLKGGMGDQTPGKLFGNPRDFG